MASSYLQKMASLWCLRTLSESGGHITQTLKSDFKRQNRSCLPYSPERAERGTKQLVQRFCRVQ